MYSFFEPGCFYFLPRCNGAPSPACIQLFLNISVNRVEVKGLGVGEAGVLIRRFGVDSAGSLYAAVRSMLAVCEKMRVYPDTPSQRTSGFDGFALARGLIRGLNRYPNRPRKIFFHYPILVSEGEYEHVTIMWHVACGMWQPRLL